MADVKLHGRVIIEGNIRALTGLHIGGRPTGIEIGGIDNIVLRNPVNGQPYIPGSSLKGKMRSLLERATGAPQNHTIDQVSIHSCHKSSERAYAECDVCPIFGMPAEGDVRAKNPTPLVVRDVPLWMLTSSTFEDLPPAEQDKYRDYLGMSERLQADNFSEAKWEAVIDRVTSAAVPRQMERVPAGARFRPFEIVYNVYSERGLERLQTVFLALQLVQDDYLGGQGSRGSGKVAFEDLTIVCRVMQEGVYVERARQTYDTLEAAVASEAWRWAQDNVPLQQD